MSFVFFHGIEQQGKTPGDLLQLWTDSVRVGLDRAKSNNRIPDRQHVVMPYYGDLLAKISTNDRRTIADDFKLRRSISGVEHDLESDRSQTLKDWIREISYAKPSISTESQIVGNQRARGFKSNALSAVSTIIPLSLQNRVVNNVLLQVSTYLDEPLVKKKILTLAKSALHSGASLAEASNEPLIVVAHSLGTVVALEALAQFNDRKVDLLMTIGSPLCAETVASRMDQTARRWPSIVDEWVNVSDPDDVVALYHSIDRRNFFKNNPDYDLALVCNICDIKNHMDNHHGIAGYLDDPIVANRITSLR